MIEQKTGLSICTLDTCSALQGDKGVLVIADVREVLAMKQWSCQEIDGLLKYTAERHAASQQASQSASYRQISSLSISPPVSQGKSSKTGNQPAG